MCFCEILNHVTNLDVQGDCHELELGLYHASVTEDIYISNILEIQRQFDTQRFPESKKFIK